MVKYLRLITPIMIFALITACGSTTKIHSDYDRSVDFSQYKTYGYYSPMGIENPNYSSLLGQMFRDAIDVQMKQRGYVKSSNPDVLFNVSARMQDKTRVTTTTNPGMYGGYYGYRSGYYGAWGAYPYAQETHVSQYTEGTFNIDLVDAKRKQLVWEAVGIGRVSEADLENLEERVKEGVPRFFERYPFVAGDPNPRPTG